METALSSACMLNDKALIATRYPVMSMLQLVAVVPPIPNSNPREQVQVTCANCGL